LDDVAENFRSQVQAAASEAVDRIALEGGRWSEQLTTTATNAKDRLSSMGEGISARDVLDRLEADYKLLRDIVGNLHERVASLGSVELAVASTAGSISGTTSSSVEQLPPAVEAPQGPTTEAEWQLAMAG